MNVNRIVAKKLGVKLSQLAKQLRYLYTIKYWTMKSDEVVTHVMGQMNLENE